MGHCFVIGGQDDWFNSVLISYIYPILYTISCSNLYCDWGVVGAFRGLDDAVARSEAECNMGATMTWGSSVITGGWGCRSFLGFVHPSKGAHLRQQSVLNCGFEKKLTPAKRSRASLLQKSQHEPREGDDDFAAILHDSNTCQEVPWVPTRFAYYLHLQCESAFPWTQ